MEVKRVVVTGIGALTPLGNNVQDYWNGLINGVPGADFITQFDASKFKTRFACEIKNFDPLKYFDRKSTYDIICSYFLQTFSKGYGNFAPIGILSTNSRNS